MKKCSKCRVTKSLVEFHKKQSYLQICYREYNQTPKRKAVREKYDESSEGKAVTKQYSQSPGVKAWQKKYAQTPERKVWEKKWRQTPIGKAYQKRQSQSLKRIERQRLRNLVNHLYSTLGTKKSQYTHKVLGYSADALENHLSRFRGSPCLYHGSKCLGIVTKEIGVADHIIPLSILNKLSAGQRFQAGVALSQLWNLRLLCGPCNLEKRDELEWPEEDLGKALLEHAEELQWILDLPE